MTSSMTAFARSESDQDGYQLIWEVRSVNHRYLDIQLKLPEDLRGLDAPCREAISKDLNRGRIDAQLKREKNNADNNTLEIDENAVSTLVETLEQIERAHPGLQSAKSTDILRWPGIITDKKVDKDKMEQQAVASLSVAVAELIENRKREGSRLAELITDRIKQCKSIVDDLSEDIPKIMQLTHEKWQSRVQEIAKDADPERMAQEIAILLTKSDVSEELDRFNTHLDEVQRLLTENKAVGRSLDFLMQELNREANTLGSKSVENSMTNASIELKVLVDQMREQVQNIE